MVGNLLVMEVKLWMTMGKLWMLVGFRCVGQGLCTPVHLEVSLDSQGRGLGDPEIRDHDGNVAPGEGLETEMWHRLGN